MKTRAFVFTLIVGVVSMTSGCHCFRCMFPNAGWRFHEGWWGHGGCAPCGTCGPATGPIAYRPPVVVPNHDCVGCNGAVPGMGPGTGYPTITYPPIIGNPVPIPGGPSVIPSSELPAPMPNKKNGN
jgi:hypothetical protein